MFGYKTLKSCKSFWRNIKIHIIRKSWKIKDFKRFSTNIVKMQNWDKNRNLEKCHKNAIFESRQRRENKHKLRFHFIFCHDNVEKMNTKNNFQKMMKKHVTILSRKRTNLTVHLFFRNHTVEKTNSKNWFPNISDIMKADVSDIGRTSNKKRRIYDLQKIEIHAFTHPIPL